MLRRPESILRFAHDIPLADERLRGPTGPPEP